jgi:hypothetical protein
MRFGQEGDPTFVSFISRLKSWAFASKPCNEVVRVSQKGQTTIRKDLREKFESETQSEVFIYEE